MTRHDPIIRLRHMLDAARAASEWVAGMSRSEFDSDLKLQSAVIYRIQIVGEAASRIPESFRTSHLQIPWPEIVGMRQILVHAYMDVDLDVVWKVAKEQLPTLIEEIERILEEQ